MNNEPHDLSRWTHAHRFAAGNAAAERGTHLVMWITIATMLLEIVAGWWFNSMAVLADGWHMSSHALAIGLSAFAYGAARKYASDPSFAFGTWKIEILAGYTSAIFLLGVAGMMIFGSLERLWAPQTIHYPEAMAVAAFGLAVNLVCALILGQAHDHHDHDHAHGHDHEHHHHDDLNLKSAYIHVITDALTSVLAIAALAGGWFYGWDWLDAATGLVGAVLVGLWAKNLILQSGRVLLDREMDHPVVEEIREVIAQLPAAGQTQLTDLHVWRVGTGAYACALSLLTHDAELSPPDIRQALAIHEEIVHVTVEIVRCDECS
jgi:cation diffusion facilitator family transporter